MLKGAQKVNYFRCFSEMPVNAQIRDEFGEGLAVRRRIYVKHEFKCFSVQADWKPGVNRWLRLNRVCHFVLSPMDWRRMYQADTSPARWKDAANDG